MTDSADTSARNYAIAWFVIGIVVFLGTMGGVLGYAMSHKISTTKKDNLEHCVELQYWSREAKAHPGEKLPVKPKGHEKDKGKPKDAKGHEWPPDGLSADDLKTVKGTPTTLAPYATLLFDRSADDCFCERIRDGAIPQPASTWSTLGFPLVALAFLLHMVLERRPGFAPRRKNAFTESTFFAGWYGIVVVLMGPGSMCLHATMTKIGGFLDLMSLVAFSSFIFAYDISGMITRLAGWSNNARIAWFVPLYFVFAVGLGVWIWFEKEKPEGNPTLIFILSGVGAGVLDMFLILRLFRRNRFFFWGSGRLFALAFFVWLCSRGIIPLCNPDTFFQWHAWWHIIAALFTGWIYLYLRTEDETAAPAGATCT